MRTMPQAGQWLWSPMLWFAHARFADVPQRTHHEADGGFRRKGAGRPQPVRQRAELIAPRAAARGVELVAFPDFGLVLQVGQLLRRRLHPPDHIAMRISAE